MEIRWCLTCNLSAGATFAADSGHRAMAPTQALQAACGKDVPVAVRWPALELLTLPAAELAPAESAVQAGPQLWPITGAHPVSLPRRPTIAPCYWDCDSLCTECI